MLLWWAGDPEGLFILALLVFEEKKDRDVHLRLQAGSDLKLMPMGFQRR